MLDAGNRGFRSGGRRLADLGIWTVGAGLVHDGSPVLLSNGKPIANRSRPYRIAPVHQSSVATLGIDGHVENEVPSFVKSNQFKA